MLLTSPGSFQELHSDCKMDLFSHPRLNSHPFIEEDVDLLKVGVH